MAKKKKIARKEKKEYACASCGNVSEAEKQCCGETMQEK